jgi:ParB family chromosome partitioning protein
VQPGEALIVCNKQLARTINDLVARADASRPPRKRRTRPRPDRPSLISDRMEPKDESYRALRDSIAVMGQTSPVFVRPHLETPGRYQVAFGHRCLRAVAELRRPVCCIVEPLTDRDRDLVIAQGQESRAQSNLSSSEVVSRRLCYEREAIMQVLSTDKTTLSRLMSVADRLPSDIVDAVGLSPAVGRLRWIALAAASPDTGWSGRSIRCWKAKTFVTPLPTGGSKCSMTI